MNIAIYTCVGSDNSMLSCETNRNGSYTVKCEVAGCVYKRTYYSYTKVQALAAFRREVRQMCEDR